MAKKNKRHSKRKVGVPAYYALSFGKFGPQYVLESGSVSDIERYQKNADAVAEFNWKFYAELAYQRSQIEGELVAALSRAAIGPYRFDHWQRAVKWKYSLDPLNTRGSVQYGGGRFNIGKIDPKLFPIFPALYITEDKDTALQETLGQSALHDAHLLAQEIALGAPQSESLISVSGKLETIINLSNAENLQPFVDLLAEVKIPSYLHRDSKKLGIGPLSVLKTTDELKGNLLDPNWRVLPQVVDVPANSQLFGQLVRSAGIGGILYPSKFTDKKCLVLYPQNFENTSSYIELDDECPENVSLKRIDKLNWRLTQEIL